MRCSSAGAAPAVGTSPTDWPPRSTSTRSQTSSTSSRRCETKMTDANSRSRRTWVKSVSISVDSSTEVGSSRMITGGLEVRSSIRSTLAISTIWRSAKVSVSVRASGSMCGADLVELHLGQLAHGVPAVDAAAYAGTLAAEHDVLGGGEVGDQRLLLEHHADAVVGGLDDAAQPHLLAAHPDLTGVGRTRPTSALRRVDLPAPFSPARPSTSFCRTTRSTPSSALTPG